MDKKKIPAKRVGIVSLKLIKENSVLYETRTVSNPYDAYKLIKNLAPLNRIRRTVSQVTNTIFVK